MHFFCYHLCFKLILDVQVFHRERLNGHYGVLAFVVGNTLSSIPFLFLISLVSSSIVYFMAQLHQGFDHFGYFVLSLFVQVTIVESLMMAVASIVPNFLMGIITGAGIQVNQSFKSHYPRTMQSCSQKAEHRYVENV